MQEKTVAESAVIMQYTPMPDETNTAGYMHGGHLLKHIDTVGAMAAWRHARARVVTAALERMEFFEPIRLEDMITFKACVQLVGRTSIETGVRVEVENLNTGHIRHAASCYLTFVALDENGNPTEVPPLVLLTEEEKRRGREANIRREQSRRNRHK